MSRHIRSSPIGKGLLSMKKSTSLAVLMLSLSAPVLLVLILLAPAACSRDSSADNSSTTASHTVKMSGAAYDISSITIPKGGTITFVTEQGTAHNLVTGANGKTQSEDGAADLGAGGHLVNSGSSWTTPPWNLAGTFHVTCTYHPAMNLTVTVTG